MRNFSHLSREEIEVQLDLLLDVRENVKLDEAIQLLGFQNHNFKALSEQIGNVMALIDDIKTKLDAANTKLDANTSTLNGIADFITSLKAQITALQTALDNAGTDPVKLAAVSDGLGALNDKLDAQATAEAALNNTTPATP